MIGFIQGVRVIADPCMQKETTAQNKKLPHKRWMKGRCYCLRVNKKWLKRFGVKTELHFLTNGSVIYAHPDNAQKLIDSLGG